MVIAEIVRFTTGAQEIGWVRKTPPFIPNFLLNNQSTRFLMISYLSIHERSLEKPTRIHQRVPKTPDYHPESPASATIILHGHATRVMTSKLVRDILLHRSPLTMPLIMVRFRPLFLSRVRALPGS
jgi:hypothetical protein